MRVSYKYSHALNGFKQVQIAYLAAISYLDKLVQPSNTMYTNQAKGYAQGLLSNAWHFDLRVVMVIMQQLLQLINGDVILMLRQEG